MTYENISRDRYNDGSDITCVAVGSVAGKTFLAYANGLRGGLITVATAKPGSHVAGVAKYDAAKDGKVGVARGSSRVLTVTAGTNLVAGNAIEVGEAGKAVPHSAGQIVGWAVDNAKTGEDALISLAY